MYQLYPRNQTTADRHASRRHKDNFSDVVVKPYYDESIRKAREKSEEYKYSAKSGSCLDSTTGRSDIKPLSLVFT